MSLSRALLHYRLLASATEDGWADLNQHPVEAVTAALQAKHVKVASDPRNRAGHNLKLTRSGLAARKGGK